MNIFEKEIVNECEMCGNKTIFPQTAAGIVVCRLCSMKLKMAKWKDRTYSDNEEVEKQKQEAELAKQHSALNISALKV